MSPNKFVSLVIPCYCEEKNIDRTLDAILAVAQEHSYDFEVIAVDDGSKDRTWQIIIDYASKFPQVRGIHLTTNFGQSAAYQAGFDAARGDYVITVSADLEIPLENIRKVVEYLDKGYDFVNTNRIGRWGNEGATRVVKSNFANALIRKISGVAIQDRGSGMKGFKRTLIQDLRLYGEMHRLIPDYLSVYGATMMEFDVEFRDRDYGESAYKGSQRTVKVLLDIVTLAFLLYFARKPFWLMPGRLFGFTGVLLSLMGGVGAGYLFVLKLLGESVGNRPLLTFSFLLIIVGIQSVMMGMLGELMMRIYFESSRRKTYVVRERVNHDDLDGDIR